MVGNQFHGDSRMPKGGPQNPWFSMVKGHRVPGVGHTGKTRLKGAPGLKLGGSRMSEVQADPRSCGKATQPSKVGAREGLRGEGENPESPSALLPEGFELGRLEGSDCRTGVGAAGFV